MKEKTLLPTDKVLPDLTNSLILAKEGQVCWRVLNSEWETFPKFT